MKTKNLVSRLIRNHRDLARFFSCCGVMALTMALCFPPPAALATFSFDFNGDGVVDGVDFQIWNTNKFTSGAPFGPGDANGDGYVGFLGDINVWLCQVSFGANSTATASATYNPGTGIATVNVAAGPFLDAIYLVNTYSTNSSITSAPFFSAGSDVINNPIAFAAGSQSVSHFGQIFPGSATVTVPANTPVGSLAFFYQNQSFPMQPIPILDTSTNRTFVPTIPSALCNCPEPAAITLALLLCGSFGLFRTRNGKSRSEVEFGERA